MDTLEINESFLKYPNYIGTFACDQIPVPHRRPCALIINTDPASKPGTHWICVFLNKDLTGEYFDSFGLPPLRKEFTKFLSQTCPLGYVVNKLTIQDVTSENCGLYCILYVKLRFKGYSPSEIYSLFCADTLLNDAKISVLQLKSF